MSNDNKNADPFNFDFDSLNEGKQEKPEESFDLDNPFGDELAPTSSKADVSADTSDLNDSADIPFEEGSAEEYSETGAEEIPPIAAGQEKGKKKGFLGGLFGGKKDKVPKEKAPKEKKTQEKQVKPLKEKKEKIPKDKEAADAPAVPRDWGTILCIAFSVFLLVSLLIFNVAAFLTAGGSLMQTLCFLGAFNIVGLVLVAVPILFYKFPQERTLPNVLLGLSVGALFTSVLLFVHNFYYYYDFTLKP